MAHDARCLCYLCRVDRARRVDFRFRLIEATQGNQSLLGAVVLAAIGKTPANPPYLSGRATITSDGLLMCDFTSKDGVFHPGALVGDDEDFARNLLGLCNHCQLNNDEKIEFLARVNHWIEFDHRDPARRRKKLLT